jgi:hypothetical protein
VPPRRSSSTPASGLLTADGEPEAPLEEIYKSTLNIKPNAKKQYGA